MPLSAPERCTRQRSNGQPCRGQSVGWSWSSVNSTPVPPSCWHHLTKAERAELAAGQERAEQRYQAANAVDPACWSWPLPLDDETETYGLSTEILALPGMRQSMRLSRWQAGRCAICDGPAGQVEDHCHRSGLFRGYLCLGCNVREGVQGVPLFQKYRSRPPAVILGFTYRYVGFGYPDGALADDWVVKALGPVPPDYTPAAAEYLAAASALPLPSWSWSDNAANGIGL